MVETACLKRVGLPDILPYKKSKQLIRVLFDFFFLRCHILRNGGGQKRCVPPHMFFPGVMTKGESFWGRLVVIAQEGFYIVKGPGEL